MAYALSNKEMARSTADAPDVSQSEWTADLVVPYDLGWLAVEAHRQFPGDAALHTAIATAPAARSVGSAYVEFVSPERPNEPGSAWQFERNVVLEGTAMGMVVVDLLTDGRLGGIEFPDRVRG